MNKSLQFVCGVGFDPFDIFALEISPYFLAGLNDR